MGIKDVAIPIGLYKGDNSYPLPLKNISYSIVIEQAFAHITLSQEYENTNVSLLSTIYLFPINSIGCFAGFEAIYEDRTVKGIIKEKNEAKKEYQHYKEHGHTAAYGEIDENCEDIMRVELGNLLPHAKVTIKLSFILDLEITQSKFYKLFIPSTLTPRYVPSSSQDLHNNEEAQQNGNQPLCLTTNLAYPWNINVQINESKIATLEVLSHPDCIITSEQHSTHVKFSKEEFPNKDFSLIFGTNEFGHPRVNLGEYVSTATTGGLSKYCIGLSFVPDFNEKKKLNDAIIAAKQNEEFEQTHTNVLGEFIFFIDRSGSMEGGRITRAKEALSLFIKSFPYDCYFNVVSFGSNSTGMFPNSIKYSESSSKTALEKIASMDADMGGTEILQALEKTFKQNKIKNYPRKIFLLTDGDVSDVNSVLKLINKNCDGNSTRLYTIGVGNGASVQLIQEGAIQGKGSYEFIQDTGDISGRIIGLLQKALLPNIINLELKYKENEVSLVAPLWQNHMSLAANSMYSCFFFLTDIFEQKKKFEFEVNYQESQSMKKFSKKFVVDISMAKKTSMYHKLGVKSLVKCIDAGENNAYLLNKSNAKDIALAYQILYKATAFVCLISENSIDKDALPNEKIIVPNLVSSDYFGVQVEEKTHKLDEYLDKMSIQTCKRTSNIVLACAAKKKQGFFSGIIGSLFGSKSSQAPPVMYDASPIHNTCNAQKIQFSLPVSNYDASMSMPTCSMQMQPPPMRAQVFASQNYPAPTSTRCNQNIFAPVPPESCSISSETAINSNMVLNELCDARIQNSSEDEECEFEEDMNENIKVKSMEKEIFSPSLNLPEKLQEENKPSNISMKSNMLCDVEEECKQDSKQTLSFKKEIQMEDSEQISKEQSSKKKIVQQSVPKKKPSESEMNEVLKMQSFNGKWCQDQRLLSLLGIIQEDIDKINATIGQNFAADILITLIVLAWLDKHFKAKSKTWGLIQKKGEEFLKSNGVNASSHLQNIKLNI